MAPSVLAIVVTGYLAWGAWVSARDPRWLYLGQQWWRVWLRPGRDGAPILVAALWLGGGALFWWPRRRQLQDTGIVLVVAMVLIGAFLGTASLAPCRGGQTRTAVVAWVISLYVGALEPRYGPGTTCPGQYPLALQLARAVCLGATLVGALAAAAVLWGQPVARLRARLVTDVTILTGLDAMTIPLLSCLTAAGRARHVVVIEADPGHPLLDDAQRTGAQIVVADPASADVLRPLLRGWRGPQLRHLFSLHPDAGDNEAVLSAARLVLGTGRADPDRPPHLIARIDDPRHADLWRGERIGTSGPWFEDALSPEEATACAVVGQVLRAGSRQVLLCGDNALALAVLLELAYRAWENRGLARAAARGRGPAPAGAARDCHRPPDGDHDQACRVVLMDSRAVELRREYLATSPASVAAALPVVSARPVPWRDHLLPSLDAMGRPEAARTAVIITDAPTAASAHAAGRAARLHPDTPVFVLSAGGAGVNEVAFDRLRHFHRAFLVNGTAPEDRWTRIARHWHEDYRLMNPATPGSGKERTRRPWADLDSFVREDNILQLRSVMAAVAAGSRRWMPARAVPPGSFIQLSEDEIAEVARKEHGRWYERRRKAGWQAPGAGQPDDDTALLNSAVLPWEGLAAEARTRQAEQVRTQLAQLEAVGFMPVVPARGPATAADFRRVGEVQARRLATRRLWRHNHGGRLVGAPGDWHVVDDRGNERTIREAEFRATHQRLDGSRWRRTGTVRAWPADGTFIIRTLEGDAVARPGDWIVEGPHGERWPVPDEQFRRSHQPANENAQ